MLFRDVLFSVTLTIVFRVLIFSFLFLWFSANICQFFFVIAIKTLMMEVTFNIIFSNLVKVVHVELHESKNTCLTKEE